MLDLRQLEALVALSRHGTVSAAAQALGYSQPTVSHHLAALARSTGTVLLARSGRGVRLTREGRALAARGEEILGLVGRAEREARAMARAEAGRVRLAAFPSAVASFVPDVLDVLGRRSPGLVVELVDAEPPEALDALGEGQVDAVLSFSYPDSRADAARLPPPGQRPGPVARTLPGPVRSGSLAGYLGRRTRPGGRGAGPAARGRSPWPRTGSTSSPPREA